MTEKNGYSFKRISAATVVRCLVFAWLTAVLTEYWLLPKQLRDLSDLAGMAQMSLSRVIGLSAVWTLALTALSGFAITQKFLRPATAAAFAALWGTALVSSFTWGLLGAGLIALVGFAVYAKFGWESRPEPIYVPKKSAKSHVWVTVGVSATFFLLVSAWGVGRVRSFSTPSYDFGIFAQMFHNMKNSGLPLTTLERDGLLSHFAVHVSPIYYLLLPFYCLAPYPATLQVLQAAVITSAVIPLWLIGKGRGLSSVQRVLLCAILLFYPAYAGGTGYDIHENCFLTVLLLWLFYGIDRENIPVTAVAAALTLTVKEDAAVYVAVIGVYLIVKAVLRKQWRFPLVAGAALLCGALGWFFAVTQYLSNSGDGVMTWRYQNFLYDGSSSLVTVVKSVILNPVKALYECVDAEKLKFIALTLGPLLCLPLVTRRFERYILLIPYLLVNLMPDYVYQHDIYFQYCFGSIAFLMYLTVVNLADLKIDKVRFVSLAASATACAICFCVLIVPTAVYYPSRAVHYAAYYQTIRDALDTIPQDASVAATTFYTTRLSDRETLYDVRYCSREHLLQTQYVALSLGATDDCRKYSLSGGDDGVQMLCALLERNGYEQYLLVEDILVIYRKN